MNGSDPVHLLFEQQVVRSPVATALEIGDTRLSYADLNEQANRFAHLLLERGVQPGDFVGVCLDRSVAMVAAILGILKANAVYVPLDPEYPADRLSYMLADSGVEVLFARAAEEACLGANSVEILATDDLSAFDAYSPENPGLPVSDDQLIYVIYTSGSTGKPKGSLLYHRGFTNLVQWYIEEFAFNSDTRVLHMTSPAFDLTQKNVFAPLLCGGTLCLLDQRFYDAAIIVDHIERHAASIVNCTPSAFSRLFNYANDALYRRLASLRYVFLGGEPIVMARLKPWLDNPHCKAQIVNTYGPTECTDVVSYYRVESPANFMDGSVPIGKSLPGFQLHILNRDLQPLPIGEEGQLCIAGIGVGAGYHNNPEMTAEKFLPDPFTAETAAKIYLTGDSAALLPDGNIDYRGRIDTQVKVRGFRIELGEIERALEQHEAIQQAAVAVFPDRAGDNRLAAYLIFASTGRTPPINDIRAFLQQSLPDFMLPTAWVVLKRLPLTPNGKLDRKALPEPTSVRPDLDIDFVAPANPAEELIAGLWLEVLGLDRVGVDDRFFELGGSSLNAVDFVARLGAELGERIPITSFFDTPTVRRFVVTLWADHRQAMTAMFPDETPPETATFEPLSTRNSAPLLEDDIAIIGMAGRFPDAADIDELWENLLEGLESVRFASDEELREAGVSEEDIADPDYVRAWFSLDDVEYFDAGFFGYQPREVEAMDPQHRLFLEMAWSALDNAGYAVTENYAGRIGVFGGVARDAYLHHYVSRHPRYSEMLGDFSVNMGNDKNFPAGRVAYKLNLKGPAINVQTACSTSGVALHLACQSLRSNESDMALVGGCRVLLPNRSGYRYVEGSALSSSGHLYSFDERGTGMVRGSGAAFLLVKRLADAQRDGDCIRAVIKSTAINNDGSAKVGFTAPSVEGQAEAISTALQKAGVDPTSIGYVEAHGTATALGDPIEVRALTRAYRRFSGDKQYCRIGSIKTNIGHLDAGAAAAGIIKTVLSLEHGYIPASLNYANPNPDIDFANSPFTVNSSAHEWPATNGRPRRAGVSSFGLGGTNFHTVLEQAPPAAGVADGQRQWQLITLSARTAQSLNANIGGLVAWQAAHQHMNVADMAYSLNTCRPGFQHRAALLCRSGDNINESHLASLSRSVLSEGQPKLLFLLPDIEATAVLENIGAQLWRDEPVYRDAIAACSAALAPVLSADLGDMLYSGNASLLTQDPSRRAAACFAIEYALANVWQHWGVQPDAFAGAGTGGLVAACMTEALSLDDALLLAVTRAESVANGEGEALQIALQKVQLASPRKPLLSVSSGVALTEQELANANAWLLPARQNEQLHALITALNGMGPVTCIDLGPEPGLSEALLATNKLSEDVRVIGAMADPQDGERATMAALAEVWCSGHRVDWKAFYAAQAVHKVPLPPFRFDRQRYWVDLPHKGSRLFTIATGSAAELQQSAAAWADYLARNPDADLTKFGITGDPDKAGPARLSLVAASNASAAQLLQNIASPNLQRGQADNFGSVVFMFPGGGAQYLHMARGLYERLPVFRRVVDDGLALLSSRTGYDLKRAWFPHPSDEAWADAEMQRPSVQLPALFITEIALARLWMSWGVQPAALIGHSLGENTAACLAGVFSFADGLGLVTLRGQLFEQVEAGGMLSVALSAQEITAYLGDDVDLATINAPEQCTVSGRRDALEKLQLQLEQDEVDCQLIPIAIAAHSRWLQPILEKFGDYLRGIDLNAPTIPFISNRNGQFITDKEATDAEYWVAHLRNTVHFADGVATLLKTEGRVFLECGPGKILGSLVKLQAPQQGAGVIPSLRHARETKSDTVFLFNSIGRLWGQGVALDWAAIEQEMPGACVHLPLQPLGVVPAVGDSASQPVLNLNVLPLQPVAAAPQENIIVGSRKDLILEKLKAIIFDLSGIGIADLDADTTFLNMGFDSLFLTQANLRFKKELKVKVTLRQLLNEAPTLSTLSVFIDEQLPEDALKQEMTAPAPAAPTPLVAALPMAGMPSAGVLTAPAGDALQQAIALQIQASNALLALVQGGNVQQLPAQAQQPAAAPASTSVAALPVDVTTAQESVSGDTAHGPFKPLQKSVSKGLNDKQQHFLADFMQRYMARTAKSRDFAEQHRAHYADPRTVMGFKTLWKDLTYTLVAERSKGSHVWDIDGNEYVDCMGGFGAIFFGHAPDFVLDAVRAQMEKTVDYGPQSQLAGPAAKMLCEMTGMERASFCNTGSEAVLAAMRIARTVTGNDLIVVFSGDYHGIFDEVLVKSQQVGSERRNMPVAPGIPASANQNILVLDYGDPKSVEVIRERAEEIAAVVIEPIQSRRPELTPREFLHQVRAVTREADIPMVFDEIITGFRLHPRGAQAWFDVDVDIACYGKVIGGGFPVGVVAGKAKYLDALDGGAWQFGDDSFPEVGVTYFAGTFIRHPTAIAAVHAVLKKLKQEGPELQAAVNRMTAVFAELVNREYRRRGIPIEINYFGSAFLLRYHGDADYEGIYHHHLRYFGAHHIWGNRPGFLTTAHTDEDIEFLIDAFVKAAVAMQEGGFLPALDEVAAEQYPWTSMQSELWLACELGDAAAAAYNEQVIFDIENNVDERVMELALDRTINKHPGLRAVVAQDKQGMLIKHYMSPEWRYEDLSELDGAAAESEYNKLAAANVDQAFDFTNGPLLRVLLLKMTEGKYRLCLAASHLVCDGWSLEKVMEDIAGYYTGIAQGRHYQRRPAPQLADFFKAEQERLASKDYVDAREFWQSIYQDNIPPPLELPLDHPRPRCREFNGQRSEFRFDNSVMRPLREYAKSQGCTTFVLLLTAFNVLLSRLGGQQDVVVGVPAAGQPNIGMPNLVAHCVSFLPLRCRIDGELAFEQLLPRVRDSFLDAKDNQDFAFGDLLQTLRVPREPGRLPLVSANFNLDMPFNALDFDGANAEFLTTPRNYVKYDLSFNLTDEGEFLRLEVDHCSDLFDLATVERWVQSYLCILQNIARAPETPVVQLALSNDAEQESIKAWNETSVAYPLDKVTLHSLVETMAGKTPAATAILFEQESLSYEQLDSKANQLAHYLLANGVQADQAVAVLMNRSLMLPITLLAILKAGGAYLPLDPEFPAERIRFILEDAGVKQLLTEQCFLDMAPDGFDVTAVDQRWSEIAEHATAALASTATPDNLAYIIYTSGSTGQPKGVMVEHKSICNHTLWMAEHLNLAANDRVLQKTPYTFDVSLWELFVPLVSGAQLVMAKPEGHKDTRYLVDTIEEYGITHIHFVASMLTHFLSGQGLDRCKSLRCMLTSGEAVTRELENDYVQHFADVPLWNLYGPTEAAVHVTSWRCAMEESASTVPIGKPIANTKLYIVNEEMQLQPVGVTGELLIGGVQVARGYINRDELTRERFVADSFSDEASARLYKTGDLCRYRDGGVIEYMGRNDFQVKIRGLRIELGEIESVLLSHTSITQSVVLAKQENGDATLIAYMVSSAGEIETSELRDLLRSRVPGYMVPQFFVFVDAMPLTISGKTDRTALLGIGYNGPDRPSESGDSPRLPEEIYLAGLWKEYLDESEVFLDDNFFDIGGHSLLAAKICARIEEERAIKVPLRALITSTLGQIARLYLASPANDEGKQGQSQLGNTPVEKKGSFISNIFGPRKG